MMVTIKAVMVVPQHASRSMVMFAQFRLLVKYPAALRTNR